MAVAALVATAVFGASLSNLVSTPALYGMNWQVDLSSVTYQQIQAVVRNSAGNPAITKITAEIVGKFVEVRGITVPALIVEVPKGPMAFSLVVGRYPTGEGKIALGATTLAQAGAHIGSRVPVTIFNSTAPPTPPSSRWWAPSPFLPNSARAVSASEPWSPCRLRQTSPARLVRTGGPA